MSGFGTTLVALTLIITAVIPSVTSNLVLSLGIVGALSIRRAQQEDLADIDLIGIQTIYTYCFVEALLSKGFSIFYDPKQISEKM